MTRAFVNSRNRAWKAVLAALCAAALLFASAIPKADALSFASAPGSTSLSITSEEARLVGSQALVSVRCEGPRGGLCSGTLRLSLAGKTRQAPFSVLAGSRQALGVSLGHGLAARASSAVAVANTVQASGGSSQSRAVLHFH